MQKFNELQELLILISRLKIDCNQTAKIKRLAMNVNWADFIVLVKKFKLDYLLYHNIKQYNLIQYFPPQLVDDLRKGYEANKIRNCIYLEEASKLTKIFIENGISCIPVKGCVLCKTVYDNESIRYLNDIDFLLCYKDIEKFEKIMSKNGYCLGDLSIADKKILPYSRKKKIHMRMFTNSLGSFYKFVNDEMFVFCDCRIKIDGSYTIVNKMIENAENGVISAEDHLLFLCYHLYAESISVMSILNCKDLTLMKFFDVREVILKYKKILNPDVVLQKANEYKMLNALYYVLYYLEELYADHFTLIDKIHLENYDFLHTFGKNDYGGKEYPWKKTFVQRLFSLDNSDEIIQLPTWTKVN